MEKKEEETEKWVRVATLNPQHLVNTKERVKAIMVEEEIDVMIITEARLYFNELHLIRNFFKGYEVFHANADERGDYMILVITRIDCVQFDIGVNWAIRTIAITMYGIPRKTKIFKSLSSIRLFNASSQRY